MDKQHKYQWSSVKSNGEILVVRGDDWSIFRAEIDIARIWLRNEDKTEPIEEVVEKPKQFVDHTKRTWDGLTFDDLVLAKKCPECGEEAWFNEGVSKKNGKSYKNLKCKKNPEHITWAT